MRNNEVFKNICAVSGKICLSEREAGEVINNAKRHHDHRSYSNSTSIPRRKYFCKDCGAYHVTHFNKTKNMRTREILERKFYREYETAFIPEYA